MRKVFCDHCGKEIKGFGCNELDTDDCFWDSETKSFVGCDCTLCDACWEERERGHIEFDMKFLHLYEEGVE